METFETEEISQEELERREQIMEIKKHTNPHTQKCCGMVHNIQPWTAKQIYFEQKLKTNKQ